MHIKQKIISIPNTCNVVSVQQIIQSIKKWDGFNGLFNDRVAPATTQNSLPTTQDQQAKL